MTIEFPGPLTPPQGSDRYDKPDHSAEAVHDILAPFYKKDGLPGTGDLNSHQL